MSDKKLDLILNELQDMKQVQQDMKSQINSRFDTLETNLSTLNKKVDVMDQKIDGIHEQVAKNSENIAVIKDLQARQEKTIDLLSRRSIDQEAEIKRIK